MSHDTAPPAHWADVELYRGFVAEAERLEAQGYTADQVADALVALGCHLSEGIHGSSAVGDRLRRLAGLFVEYDEQCKTGAADTVTH